MFEEQETRRRLVAATSRCIVRQGSARIRVGDVADEAGVARSTVYRYFQTRGDLILGVLLSRIDAALEYVVQSLPHPDDAVRSIPELILEPLRMVKGNALNEALFSPDSRPLVTALELGSEPIVDAFERHYGPLFASWKEDGQVHDDLDSRETMRWVNAVALVLLAPPWVERTSSAKREFLHQYLVRALVPAAG